MNLPYQLITHICRSDAASAILRRLVSGTVSAYAEENQAYAACLEIQEFASQILNGMQDARPEVYGIVNVINTDTRQVLHTVLLHKRAKKGRRSAAAGPEPIDTGDAPPARGSAVQDSLDASGEGRA